MSLLQLWEAFNRVFRKEFIGIQPESIAELQRAVEDVAGTIPEEMLRDAAQNVRKRAKTCIEGSGGHFEHFLKLS